MNDFDLWFSVLKIGYTSPETDPCCGHWCTLNPLQMLTSAAFADRSLAWSSPHPFFPKLAETCTSLSFRPPDMSRGPGYLALFLHIFHVRVLFRILAFEVAFLDFLASQTTLEPTWAYLSEQHDRLSLQCPPEDSRRNIQQWFLFLAFCSETLNVHNISYCRWCNVVFVLHQLIINAIRAF